jgi:hypothetical protein
VCNLRACRLDHKNPPTAVGGIRVVLPPSLYVRLDRWIDSLRSAPLDPAFICQTPASSTGASCVRHHALARRAWWSDRQHYDRSVPSRPRSRGRRLVNSAVEKQGPCSGLFWGFLRPLWHSSSRHRANRTTAGADGADLLELPLGPHHLCDSSAGAGARREVHRPGLEVVHPANDTDPILVRCRSDSF